MKKDTIRILVDWTCNLSCSYCCNEQERFRKDIIPTPLKDIKWKDYKNICVSGGEPLMFMDKVEQVCNLIPEDKLVILYTNGILLTPNISAKLESLGVDIINIGLHYPSSFNNIISNVVNISSNIDVYFNLWEKYKTLNLEEKFPTSKFRYWIMDDCDRDNEYRVVLNSYEL